MKLIDEMVKGLPEMGAGRSDWHFVKLEKIEVANTEAGDADGWIEWAGGKCPVGSDAVVEVKYRQHTGQHSNNMRALAFDWSHDHLGSDIIAYRLHQPQTKQPAPFEECTVDAKGEEVKSKVVEWGDQGLPPVGSECEANIWHSNEQCHAWRRVKVVHLGEPGGWKEALVFDLETTIPTWADEFRPIRTEAERQREAALKAMIEILQQGASTEDDANNIYDAIVAGKITGVEVKKC